MIVWINGPYGSGKTTLVVEELVRRRPDAVMLDPEYVGYWLRQTVSVPTDNVQDLRGWREIVVASVLSVHRHHAQLLLVPMTLINPAYRDEVLGALHTAGVELLEVFLEVSLRSCAGESIRVCFTRTTGYETLMLGTGA